jgi:hypothetical protein
VQFAAGQGRFEDVAGVHRPAVTAAAPGAHHGVQFVDEDDQPVGVAADLLDDVVHPLLEVAPVAGARDDPRQVQGDHPPPGEHVRDVVVRDPLGQALHDRRLADARVADQHRVVLAAPGEHLDGLLDLLLPPDHRVDPALAGQVGEVAAVLVQGRRVRGPRSFGTGLRGIRRLLGQAGRREAGRVQDVPGGRVGVGRERAEHVLRADVPVPAGPGHVVRVQQGALGGRGQRERGRRRRVLRAVPDRSRALVDRRGQRIGVRARPAEQTAGRFRGQGGAQQVLGVQVPAAVLGGVLGRPAHQLPRRLAQQSPDVDLARAGTAEEPGEELCEGVALRADETARHRYPFLRCRRAGAG